MHVLQQQTEWKTQTHLQKLRHPKIYSTKLISGPDFSSEHVRIVEGSDSGRCTVLQCKGLSLLYRRLERLLFINVIIYEFSYMKNMQYYETSIIMLHIYIYSMNIYIVHIWKNICKSI